MLGKVVGSFLAGILVVVVALQVTGASANSKNKPLTSPITSPITSPSNCKPGWGFGDKNHCHSGPRGLSEKEEHHTATVNAHHEDDHGNNGKNHH
jgi:hypothetical protein